MLYIEGEEASAMTIKELEISLGMTRANIRFYEQEGFLTPERGANNYRIYSEEDVETLRKIKLLRQLGLPLDTIKQVQSGELGLDTALARQQRTLEEQHAELAWADRVCASMRSDRVEYATLDAQKYLDTLDRPAEGEGYFSLRKDSTPMVAYPWRRFFARWLDLFLYGTLWSAFGLLVMRFNPPSNLFINLLSMYRDYATMLVVEPLLLSTWGYTPGKWIFGLRVRGENGGKISWGDAQSRTWLVFTNGCGYGVPFYNLYRYYKSYKACTDCETLPWEEGRGYAIKDTRVWRCVGFVGAAAALFMLLVFTMLQAQMPRYRGELTAGQYVYNVNDLYHYISQDAVGAIDLDGKWLGRENILYGVPPDHQITVDENGVVTAVTLVEEGTGEQYISGSAFDKQLAALSFAAASGGYNCVSWINSGVLAAISDQDFTDYTIQAGDVTITQTVLQEGYQDAGDWLFAIDSIPEEDLYYRMEFTMTLQNG